MRRLVLLRHAEAASAPLGDFSPEADMNRPLTPAGQEAARRCGHWLAAHSIVPDSIICSPALRTRQTLAGAVTALPPTLPPPDYCADIYEATPEALLAHIQQAPDSAFTVLMVGHNPGISLLAHHLDMQASELDQGFAPGAVAIFEMYGSNTLPDMTHWQMCDGQSMHLHTFARP
ncbi:MULTISPECIES: histidine phosphatase family protein [Acetobacter]|uniref:Phosphohistidine phosphatase n=2 Tax=Acetobacter TaxID=434 RepID=A0AAN1PHY6_9PROT|nr:MULTISPECIES: histidine phosphatase family protein [Acetobacter]ASL39999.1 phosphohistidine phosphatase [Acetobacter oryzifermentans]AXN00566.1 phosphohistidine phosphatase [Acetobacter pomorum]KAA8397028.1 phosphohistidine phosphatase [Acetobacter sp. DmW_125128]KAA8397824.1 phosphohistidine phosphatase [Acetobacter sp. DmW_125124]KAA8399470.1 phosphohistidine phosphatase [Acetobacter sp. DmW_125127]